MANAYHVGQLVEASVVFTADGTAVDPTTVVAKVEAPDTTETTPAVTKTGVGRYKTTFTITAAGTWHIRFNGTGAAVAAEEWTVTGKTTVF